MTHPDGIPEPITPDRPLRSDHDLLDWARFVHQDVRPTRSTLWVLLLDSKDHPLPLLLPIEDVPETPDACTLLEVLTFLSRLLVEHAPGGSVALLLERPGASRRGPGDRTWDAQIRTVARRMKVRVRAFFVAGTGSVLPMTLDDAA
ncbi:hypothetical protein [Ruania alba]|nr:hypothetical protein [Ruania alba]